MKNLIIFVLIVLGFSGCADRHKIEGGSEAIVYQELHHFIIEPKSPSDRVEVNAQIDRIISSFQPGLEQTLWTLSYRTQLDKSWVNDIEKKLVNQMLAPSRIKIEKLDYGDSVIKINIGKYKVKTQTCKRWLIESDDHYIGCFIENVRLQHVSDVQTLIVPEGL